MPGGFRAGGATAGIKASGRPDLGLVVAPDGASAAAVFTPNAFAAAPVKLSEYDRQRHREPDDPPGRESHRRESHRREPHSRESHRRGPHSRDARSRDARSRDPHTANLTQPPSVSRIEAPRSPKSSRGTGTI